MESDPGILGQDDCPSCSLLAPVEVQQLSVPAYQKNSKET